MNVVACIAPGPSLTPGDCSLVQQSGIYTVAVNTAWKFARFVDVIFAGDADWWTHYGHEIDIPAERWAGCNLYNFDTRHFKVTSGWNSGASAIRFAFERKRATAILLLGYDCSVKLGTHIHGDHPYTRNPDNEATTRWQIHFGKLASMAGRAGIEIINCSRYSELTQFPRMDLGEALSRHDYLINKPVETRHGNG